LGPALLKSANPGILSAEMPQLELDADELGSRVGVLLQPVGVDQPRGIIIGVVVNVAEEGFREDHATTTSELRPVEPGPVPDGGPIPA
jgi:hypothetical protein